MGSRLAGFSGSGRGLRREHRLPNTALGDKQQKNFVSFGNTNTRKQPAATENSNFNQLEKRRLFVSNLTHSFTNDDLNVRKK